MYLSNAFPSLERVSNPCCRRTVKVKTQLDLAAADSYLWPLGAFAKLVQLSRVRMTLAKDPETTISRI